MANRTGRKIKYSYLKLNILQDVTLEAADNIDGNVLVRFIVFWDKAPNGTDPAITEVLANDLFNSFPNLNNRQRFRILKDWVVSSNEITTSTTGPGGVSMWHSHFLPIHRSLETVYSSTSAAVPLTGGLYIMYSIKTQTATFYADCDAPTINERLCFFD